MLVLLLLIIIVFWISRSFSFTLRSTFSLRFVESFDFTLNCSRALCQLHADYAYALLQRRGAVPVLLAILCRTVYAYGTVHMYVEY